TTPCSLSMSPHSSQGSGPPRVGSPTTEIVGLASSSGYLLLPRVSDQSPQTGSCGMPFQVRDERVPVAEQHRSHHLHQAIAVIAREPQHVHHGDAGTNVEQIRLAPVRAARTEVFLGPRDAQPGGFQPLVEREGRIGAKYRLEKL